MIVFSLKRYEHLPCRLLDIVRLPRRAASRIICAARSHTGRDCRNGSRSRIRIAASMTVRRSEPEPRGSIVSPYRCSAKDFSPGDVTLVTGWSRKGSYPPSFVHTRICPGTELGSSKMSLYQTAIELRPRMSLAPALLAVRTHRVADALLVF